MPSAKQFLTNKTHFLHFQQREKIEAIFQFSTPITHLLRDMTDSPMGPKFILATNAIFILVLSSKMLITKIQNTQINF